jgi:hypothetical protein
VLGFPPTRSAPGCHVSTMSACDVAIWPCQHQHAMLMPCQHVTSTCGHVSITPPCQCTSHPLPMHVDRLPQYSLLWYVDARCGLQNYLYIKYTAWSESRTAYGPVHQIDGLLKIFMGCIVASMEATIKETGDGAESSNDPRHI